MSLGIVMVVDDDLDIREAIAITLELHGYTVLTAADGVECLERLRAGAAPDLVLLDLMMPRMNGWETCAELANDAALAHLPVVVLTGNVRVAHEELCAAAFLRKPIELDTLVETVEAHCKRKAP
jgi:CheY-like chemotaxis protein